MSVEHLAGCKDEKEHQSSYQYCVEDGFSFHFEIQFSYLSAHLIRANEISRFQSEKMSTVATVHVLLKLDEAVISLLQRSVRDEIISWN